MYRIRNKSEGSASDVFTQKIYNKYGALTGTSSETYTKRIHTDVMSDVTGRYIPDIRRPVVNGMAHYKELTEEANSSLAFTYSDGSRFTQDGLVLSHWLASSPPTWGSEGAWGYLNYSRTEGFEKVKADAISKIDKTPYAFMEDLFELKSTISSLGAPFQGALKAAGKFQQRRSGRKGWYLKKGYSPSTAAARAATDAWMASRYEFRPLMYSMFGILDTLAGSKRARPLVMRASSTSSDEGSGSKTMNGSGVVYTYTSQVKETYRAGIYYTCSNPMDGISWDLGLRLKDIPNGIWAVMPYTWVIDRFVNVSGFIRGLVNLTDPNIHILAGYQTKTATYDTSLSMNAIPSPGWTGGGSAGPRISHVEHYDRIPWSPSLLDLNISFDTSSLKDISNLADIASLIVARLR